MSETRMKVERRRRGMNQTACAYLSGLSQADISRIENRRLQPYGDQAERLAKVLNLEPEELLQPAEAE
jgi:transcriptional regulator with XRE-family HTH domain